MIEGCGFCAYRRALTTGVNQRMIFCGKHDQTMIKDKGCSKKREPMCLRRQDKVYKEESV